MNNPDVTGNNVDFQNLDIEGVLTANIATLQNLSVAGLPINPGIQTFRMPVATNNQNFDPGGNAWNPISFGGILNLILAPGAYLVFATGILVNQTPVSLNTIQIRLTDPGGVNTVTQTVIGIPISSYGQFTLITYLDTSLYGLQFQVQLNVSSECQLLGSTSPLNQFSPQFVALQLRAA